MSAADIIRGVYVHGGKVTVDGASLALSTPRPLPDELLHEFRSNKAEFLTYLNTNAWMACMLNHADKATP